MAPITSFVSEIEEKFEFIKGVKRRNMEQKFLYVDSGASKYYHSTDPTYDFNSGDFHTEDFLSFIQEVFKDKKNPLVVSLGCGDAKKEAQVFSKLYDMGVPVTLIAMDSSREMLEFAHQNLKDTKLEYQLIHTDITSLSFQDKFLSMTEGYDCCVFSLLGGTLGNMVQTEIVDTLYNLSRVNTYVWIDVLARKKNDKLHQIKLFKEYAKRLDIPSEIDFYYTPLAKIGLSKQHGVMRMYGTTEDSIGTQKFRYSFEIRTPANLVYDGQKIHLLPPENIKLMDIRVYHTPTLKDFFNAHDFILQKEQYKGNNGQFLFQRI